MGCMYLCCSPYLQMMWVHACSVLPLAEVWKNYGCKLWWDVCLCVTICCACRAKLCPDYVLLKFFNTWIKALILVFAPVKLVHLLKYHRFRTHLDPSLLGCSIITNSNHNNTITTINPTTVLLLLMITSILRTLSQYKLWLLQDSKVCSLLPMDSA